MGLIITAVYLALSILSPADIIPALAPFRIVLITTAIAAISSFLSVITSPVSLFRTPQPWLMLGLFAIVLLSLPLNGWVGGIVPSFEKFMIPTVTFFLVLVNANTLKRMEWLMGLLVALALFLSSQGIIAYHFGINEDKYLMRQWTDGGIGVGYIMRVQAAGFLGDPNDFANFLLMCLPFLGLFWNKQNPLANLLTVFLPAGILLYTVYLTASRGGLVGLFVLVALILKRRLGMLGPVVSMGFTVILLTVVGFGGGRVLGLSSGTGGSRLALWSDSFALFRESPLWGVGFANIGSYTRQVSHNSFVQCFTELGLIGLFFWLGMIVVTALQLHAIGKMGGESPEHEQVRRVARILLLSLYTFLGTAWFLSRAYVLTLYVLLAAGTSLYLTLLPQSEGTLPLSVRGWAAKTMGLMAAIIVAVYIMVRLRWLA